MDYHHDLSAHSINGALCEHVQKPARDLNANPL